MRQDPIVAEVRRVRETHTAQFNYDLHAIYHDLKLQEMRTQRKKVSFTPKYISPDKKEKEPIPVP